MRAGPSFPCQRANGELAEAEALSLLSRGCGRLWCREGRRSPQLSGYHYVVETADCLSASGCSAVRGEALVELF